MRTPPAEWSTASSNSEEYTTTGESKTEAMMPIVCYSTEDGVGFFQRVLLDEKGDAKECEDKVLSTREKDKIWEGLFSSILAMKTAVYRDINGQRQ